MLVLNRYRRGLQTCPQAKTSKSGHAIFYWPLLTSGSYNRQAKLRSDCDTYFSYHLKIITKSLILSEPVLSIYKESEKLLGQLLQDDLIGTYDSEKFPTLDALWESVRPLSFFGPPNKITQHQMLVENNFEFKQTYQKEIGLDGF